MPVTAGAASVTSLQSHWSRFRQTHHFVSGELLDSQF
jgi:hypothetical protein